MKKLIINITIVVLIVIFPVTAFSDLKVITANESDLPFELSPSKFSNSSSKFSNSVSKFSNSSSKFSNSSSRFDNRKRENTRLLLEKYEDPICIGYYAWGEDGLINFFLNDGERLFYSPPETEAIFDSEHGNFCGTLATLKAKNVLVLTEKGQLEFLKKGISLSSQPTDKSEQDTDKYSGGSTGHWIQKNIDSGSIIVLEDGSIWEIDLLDKIDTMLWLPISEITIVTSDEGSPGYDYLLINTDDEEKAHAKYLGHR